MSMKMEKMKFNHIELQTRQFHIKLPMLGLEDIVNDLAHAAYLTMLKHLHLDITKTGDEDYILIRDAIEATLRKYVIAFDKCGTNPLCWQVKEFDPWSESSPGQGLTHKI